MSDRYEYWKHGGGSSFIINERSWDCFEHGFMQGNGGCVLDSFWARTWWRIYHILFLPCAVLYYLQVSGSHTHLLFVSDSSHANNEASGFSSIPTLHHHPYSTCLRSKWNWNSEYIADPREIRSRGWAVAPGGDGDGVGWDERDAEGKRGETVRESTGEQGGRVERGRLMMQERCRKTSFQGAAGWM